MKFFIGLLIGGFAFVFSNITFAQNVKLSSTPTPSTCQIMPLVDYINRLDLGVPGFEVELLESLAQRDRKGRYFIANPECKDEVIHYLNNACDSNNRKPQVLCEMTHLLAKNGNILEKYKSLSDEKQAQVQNYFEETYIDILSKDEETIKDIVVLDEEELSLSSEEYSSLRVSGISSFLAGQIITGLSVIVGWEIYDLTRNGFLFPGVLLIPGFMFGPFISVKGLSDFLYASQMKKNAKAQLKKIDQNTGLRNSELKYLTESFIKNVELEYIHNTDSCINALKPKSL